MGLPRKFNVEKMCKSMEEYGRDWCICGCHVYHEMWEAATGAVMAGVLANFGLNTARMAHVSH